MKKLLSIFLLVMYLFSVTDIKELLKLNVLVEHFGETKKLDDSVSFIHFLVMHYITDDLNDNDNDRDMQLPFKSHDSCTANNSIVSVPADFTSLVFYSFVVNESAFSKPRDFFSLPDFDASVWHPPQIS